MSKILLRAQNRQSHKYLTYDVKQKKGSHIILYVLPIDGEPYPPTDKVTQCSLG